MELYPEELTDPLTWAPWRITWHNIGKTEATIALEKPNGAQVIIDFKRTVYQTNQPDGTTLITYADDYYETDREDEDEHMDRLAEYYRDSELCAEPDPNN